MSAIASLLAASVVAAAPTTPLPWYNFEDYPMKAFDKEWKGAASFELVVDPVGRPVSCTIIKSTGYSLLDRQTCFIAVHRARFTPARGPDGTAVYGAYRSMVKWHRPDQDSLQVEPGPDLEIAVSALPPGTKQPAAIKVAYFVDANGAASSCTILPESKSQPSSLADAACREVLAKSTPGAGNQPTVRTAAVLFTAE
jgi:TonB family protein